MNFPVAICIWVNLGSFILSSLNFNIQLCILSQRIGFQSKFPDLQAEPILKQEDIHYK